MNKISSKGLFRTVFASSIGGGLELYDFVIYIFFAPVFSELFFPAKDPIASLIAILLIFAIGYLSRPFGAILFGHLGDRIGRKKSMLISLFLMGIATALTAFLPTYYTIGLAAPIILAFLRVVQGIAVGGNLPGAITLIAEHSKNHNRGQMCAWVYCGVNIGILLASLVGTILTIFLSTHYLHLFGWRIGFFSGIVIIFLGYYLRNHIEETPYFLEAIKKTDTLEKIPLFTLFREHFLSILKGIGLICCFAVIITQVFLYMPTYLYEFVHIKLKTAMLFNSFALLIFSILIPLFGYLSDKFGRRVILWICALLFIVLSYPIYYALQFGNLWVIGISLLIFAFISAGVIGVCPATLAELFPTKVRYSGIGIAYNVGFAVFGGLTPSVATLLIKVTNNIQSLSILLITSAIIIGLTTLFIRDKANKELED